MLLASQMESGGYQLAKENINLSELVVNAVQDFRNRFPRRLIESRINDGIFLFGDSLLMQLAINNLIENALKYSPKEKPVIITLQKENEGTRFEVIDEGPGISDAEKKKVFERFYRIGSETSKQTKGTGLGLYLTKKITEDHGAEIAVSDNSPSGSIFVIRFHK
jgi:signal transduction histidine kinase